jgi:hypothetical protein
LDIENSYRKKFIDIVVAEKLDKGELANWRIGTNWTNWKRIGIGVGPR